MLLSMYDIESATDPMTHAESICMQSLDGSTDRISPASDPEDSADAPALSMYSSFVRLFVLESRGVVQ